MGEERDSALSNVSDAPLTLVKIAGLNVHLNPCKNLTEISARSRQSRRDLGEIATISARFQNISPRKIVRGEIAAILPRSARSRRDNHHLGEISKYRVEISTPRRDRNAISPRQTRSWLDNRDLGAISKYRAEISSDLAATN